jgi:hypothetical protein
MAIIDIYSKRKKAAENNEQQEIYQYTDLPVKFRRQVVHIWSSTIGIYYKGHEYEHASRYQSSLNDLWQKIHNSLARELGLFNLSKNKPSANPYDKCISFFLDEDTNIENLLDLIELTFKESEMHIAIFARDHRNKISQTHKEAIDELNHRFREHRIGYQYENGQIIRVDSYFIHAEAVIPALTLISSEGFSGAEQEFRSAHEHYRNQEYKAAIVEALKAFESKMKTICDKFNWAYDKTATASKLIDIILKREELVPSYLQTHFSGLKQVLEAGVPTVRNKTSGHGQGSETKEVPEYLAAYVLHLTASNIVLLVEAYKAKCSEVK